MSADHDAANGQCVEINRRGSHSSAHFAPADLREPAGKTRGDFRDGDREQPGDAHAAPGDDETDSAPKCFAGVPQGRDQQSEEDSRTQDSSHQLQCRNIGAVREFYDGCGRDTSGNDPTKDQNAICGVTGGQLGRNRRSGGDCDPAESAECAIDHGIQSKLTGAASTHLATTGTFVPGGVGIQHHQFWPQAQGEELCNRDATRSRISELELGKVCQPDARAPGLRALWPVVDERGGQRSVSESDFSAEVKAIRESIASSDPKPCLQTQHEAIFQTIQNFEDSLQTATVFPTSKSRVFLLEIYANPNSPLTEAVQQMGHRALRFTKQDGDLSTFSGRHKLWSWIEMYQPEHVWLAPECGPWGGWNRLNKMKSPELFDRIQGQQDEQLPHARLCERICKYQFRHGRHFHFEQPAGSSLLHLKIFEVIRQKTAIARFDMCQFGLRIPKTNRFLRKRSQLMTSSRNFSCHSWTSL